MLGFVTYLLLCESGVVYFADLGTVATRHRITLILLKCLTSYNITCHDKDWTKEVKLNTIVFISNDTIIWDGQTWFLHGFHVPPNVVDYRKGCKCFRICHKMFIQLQYIFFFLRLWVLSIIYVSLPTINLLVRLVRIS